MVGMGRPGRHAHRHLNSGDGREIRVMLNFKRFGTGSPLVLVHGFVGGSGYWLELMNSFGRWRDVIAIDLPGFAGSGDGLVQTSISGFAGTVFELLDSLAVDDFALVGHSMGGMIAQEMALSRSTSVAHLILYGTAFAGNLPGRFETWDETFKRFQERGSPHRSIALPVPGSSQDPRTRPTLSVGSVVRGRRSMPVSPVSVPFRNGMRRIALDN